MQRAGKLSSQVGWDKPRSTEALAQTNVYSEWLPVVSVALASVCGRGGAFWERESGEGVGGVVGKRKHGEDWSVLALVKLLGSQVREGTNSSCVDSAALALGMTLAQPAAFCDSAAAGDAVSAPKSGAASSALLRDNSAVSAASAVSAQTRGGGGGGVPSSLAEVILSEIAPLDSGDVVAGTAVAGLLGAKKHKHVCQMLVRRLQVLTIAARKQPAAGSGVGASVSVDAMGLSLVSRLVQVAHDVVDYVAYLDAKYLKKEEIKAKEAKRLQLLEQFVDLLIAAAPHLHRDAPGVAWTPGVRAKMMDVVAPLLHHRAAPHSLPSGAELATSAGTHIDASTHSASSDKSTHSCPSTHGHPLGQDVVSRGSVGMGGAVSLKALRAMAALQSGPVMPISAKACAVLGIGWARPPAPAAGASDASVSLGQLKEWVNKALLTYQGDWLEAAGDFLHNLLVGSTGALPWCLASCFDANPQLAHAHFAVLCRLVLSQTRAHAQLMAPEEVLVVALYMLGDPVLDVRQRAARLLRHMMARESGAAPPLQALGEVSGTDFMTPERRRLLQARASECMAGVAARMCDADLVRRVVGVLVARVADAACQRQQRQLLSLSIPWFARLNLSVRGMDAGEGAAAAVLAEVLNLTRRVHALLPSQVLALWTALAQQAGNVRVCIESLLLVSQQLLGPVAAVASYGAEQGVDVEALVAVQVAADGLTRGARTAAVDVVCESLGTRPRAGELGDAEAWDVSPALVLHAAAAAPADGGLLQVPRDDLDAEVPLQVIEVAGGRDGRAGGGGSTRREAALVLLAAGLDALLSDAACEGVACVRTHAPAILHAAVMCCAGLREGTAASPSAVAEASKWLVLRVLRVLSAAEAPCLVPGQEGDACGDRSAALSGSDLAAERKLVELAEQLLASDSVLLGQVATEQVDVEGGGAESVGTPLRCRLALSGATQGQWHGPVGCRGGGERSDKMPATSERLMEAVLGVVEGAGGQGKQVRDAWSQQALDAACFLPPAACLFPGHAATGQQGVGQWGMGVDGSAHENSCGVDRYWVARRRRSHEIYRGLSAAVRVPDVVQVLRSLANTNHLAACASVAAPCAGGGLRGVGVPGASAGEAAARRSGEWREAQDGVVQALQLECLGTLRHMVGRLDARKLILAPGLFWAAIAMLHAPGRRLYEAAIFLFADILRTIDIADTCTQNVLFRHCPQGWTPAYNGVKPLILRGLGHRRTHHVCARLLQRTINLRGGMLLDPTPHYTIVCLVAQLPLLLAVCLSRGFGCYNVCVCLRLASWLL